MKITFTCKMTMTDDLPDSIVEKVYPVDIVVKDLIKELKEGLSEKGTVDLTDCSITID